MCQIMQLKKEGMLQYLIKVISIRYFSERLYIIDSRVCDSWYNTMKQESDISLYQLGVSVLVELMLFSLCSGFTHGVGWNFIFIFHMKE